jgi:hypothetical protein
MEPEGRGTGHVRYLHAEIGPQGAKQDVVDGRRSALGTEGYDFESVAVVQVAEEDAAGRIPSSGGKHHDRGPLSRTILDADPDSFRGVRGVLSEQPTGNAQHGSSEQSNQDSTRTGHCERGVK